jgi:hypothetical protein
MRMPSAALAADGAENLGEVNWRVDMLRDEEGAGRRIGMVGHRDDSVGCESVWVFWMMWYPKIDCWMWTLSAADVETECYPSVCCSA